MKKEHYRDYAVEAFRFYAREGGSEAYKTRLLSEIPQNHEHSIRVGRISKPVETLAARWEKVLKENEGAIMDLKAVENTLKQLSKHKLGEDLLFALKETYFQFPGMPIGKGALISRVRYVATKRFVTERAVFTWLQTIREMFAVARGLRI